MSPEVRGTSDKGAEGVCLSSWANSYIIAYIFFTLSVGRVLKFL